MEPMKRVKANLECPQCGDESTVTVEWGQITDFTDCRCGRIEHELGERGGEFIDEVIEDYKLSREDEIRDRDFDREADWIEERRIRG